MAKKYKLNIIIINIYIALFFEITQSAELLLGLYKLSFEANTKTEYIYLRCQVNERAIARERFIKEQKTFQTQYGILAWKTNKYWKLKNWWSKKILEHN